MKLAYTKLPIIPSFELFVKHYKYGNNYENSTILVDPTFNIIAFFDRNTKEIDTVQTDIQYKGNTIMECRSDKQGGVEIIKHQTPHIKYKPISIDAEMSHIEEELNNLKKEIENEDDFFIIKQYEDKISYLKDKVTTYVNNENIYYFNNLLYMLEEEMEEELSECCTARIDNCRCTDCKEMCC